MENWSQLLIVSQESDIFIDAMIYMVFFYLWLDAMDKRKPSRPLYHSAIVIG